MKTVKFSCASRNNTIKATAVTSGLLCCLGAGGYSARAVASPPGGKATSAATDASRAKRQNLILQLDGSSSTAAEFSRALARMGGYVYRNLDMIHAVAVSVPGNIDLSRVEALPGVRHVSPDGVVKKTDEFTVEHTGADYAFDQLGLTGKGIGVAVIDTGVHSTNDLSQTVKGGSSRVVAHNKFGQKTDDDLCGHGTHVTSILSGNGAASTGNNYYRTFYGIARSANIVNACALNQYGSGNVSDVITAIAWVILNKNTYNIRVLNLSLGHPVTESYRTDPLCLAVELAWKSGIVVVCAAGNDGRANDDNLTGRDNEGWGTNYGSIQSPGNDPYVITVGAMKAGDTGRASDRIATYSGRGPSRLDFVMKPDIVAPGNRVIGVDAGNTYLSKTYGSTSDIPLSSYMTTKDLKAVSNRYFCLSGTSMAAPVVSGAAALMLEKYPTLTPDTVKARLMLSADKWLDPDGTGDALTYGAGYLNIQSALVNGYTAKAGLPSLSPVLAQNPDGSIHIYADSSLDGSRAIWGNFGSLDGSRALWGNRALWGSSFDGSPILADIDRALWGSSVWGDRALWGTNSNAVDLSSIVIHGEN